VPRSGVVGGISRNEVNFRAPAEAERSAKLNVVVTLRSAGSASTIFSRRLEKILAMRKWWDCSIILMGEMDVSHDLDSSRFRRFVGLNLTSPILVSLT
jgi:hypothetical protein